MVHWLAGMRSLMLLAVLTVAGSAGTATVRTAVDAAQGGTCALPLTHDHYAGFHIGVPAGWDLSTLNGTIAVTRDPSGTEAALVYPALLAGSQTPSAFLTATLRTVQQSTTAAGNTMSFQIIGGAGQSPQAVLSARVGQQHLQGAAGVRLLRDRTARAAYQAVFSAYWAPASRLAADRAALAGIGRCYAPEPGSLYQIHQDQVFTAAIPLGWSVTSEGQDAIDVTGDGGRAVASYLLTLTPAGAGVTTPRSLLRYVFGQVHIQIDRILSSTDLPSQQEANGSVQGQEYLEFLGRYQGKPVHGLVYALSDAGTAGASGVLRLGLASAGRWNADNSALIHVMGSIQHNFTQDIEQWAHLNRQWQEFDRTTQQFDNVLNGVDVVRDPSTGTLYEAPYDAYDPAGPDGPGYYRDAGAGILQKLQTVQP